MHRICRACILILFLGGIYPLLTIYPSKAGAPSKERLVFSSDRDIQREIDVPIFEGEIFTMDLDGSNLVNLHQPGTWPRWSPDGEKIAFSSFRKRRGIYVMDSDGTQVRFLTGGRENGIDIVSEWSPDGGTLAFVSDREGDSDIYLMNPLGHNIRRVLAHLGEDGGPIWSPDGKQLAFTTVINGNVSMSVVDADGGNLRALIGGNSPYGAHAWSPDGTEILLVSDGPEGTDIYSMTLADGDIRRLTNRAGNDTSPRWSPDGRFIAFEAWYGGNIDICRMDVSTGAVQRITDHPAKDRSPDVFQPFGGRAVSPLGKQPLPWGWLKLPK